MTLRVRPATWWQALRADPLPQLLDPAKPNLMWRALVDVVGRPADSPAVRRTRSGAHLAPVLATLLAELDPDGRWATRGRTWTRYSGPAWRIVAAAQLGADPADPRLAVASRRLLEDGGDGGLGPWGAALPCATTRVAAALTTLGWSGHPRCHEAWAWLEALPAAADGGWACRRHGREGGCAVTATAVLAAASSAEEVRRRGLDVRAAGALVGWHLHRASARLGWPNLLRTDLAEALAVLATSGRPFEPGVGGPLRRLQGLQDETARWRASVQPPSSLPLGDDLWTDGWVTLHALTAIARFAADAELPRLFPAYRPR